MKFSSMLFQALFFVGGLHKASSVLYGDESYGNLEGGHFWAFHSNGISVVNPESCSIDRSITLDADGNGLPRKWFDGVYMESTHKHDMDMDHMRKLLHSESEAGYILINSAEPVYDDHQNQGGGSGEVLVIRTSPSLDDNEVVQNRILVGSRPVHSYAVNTRDEFWTHSDGDGHFYVIKLEDVTKHTGKPIQAKAEGAYHGKLLWDESDQLAGIGYATSTGERALFYMHMEEHKLLGSYDYTQDLLPLPYPNYCMGTHAIAYSSVNNHLYLECVGGGGILEIDVNEPLQPVFVTQHKAASGALYEVPDGSAVVASDKTNNKLHVFQPNGKGSASSIDFQVDVSGHPTTPSFYPMKDGSSYVACMPLTENTNVKHRNTDGEIVCDVYGCGGAKNSEDVRNGVCAYDVNNTRELLEATLEDFNLVTNGYDPFGSKCHYCRDKENYDENGKCQCTPFCGSCGESVYDASLSGVQCVNLSDVFSKGLTESTLIKGAGAVEQAGPQAYSPACGFGRTYRAHKRGGKYDASIADIPVSSLQIVNMETQKLKCQVALPGNPDRVVYVPPQPGKSKGNKLAAGVIAGIVCGSLAVLVLLLWIIRRCKTDIEELDLKSDFDDDSEGSDLDGVYEETDPVEFIKELA